MPGDAYLALVERLGREFARRRMDKHLTQLRWAWPQLTRWREDEVIEWLRVFRVPPFDKDYPLQRTAGGCPRCGKHEGVWTRLVFPGGAKLTCASCRQAWVVERAL